MTPPSLRSYSPRACDGSIRTTSRTTRSTRPARRTTSQARSVKATKDIVLTLRDAGRVTPTDASERPRSYGADARITSVPAKALAFRYVDRELLLQRTRSPAKWSDERKNGGGLRLDILLADEATKTPVAAELKLPGDMDPFFALVQALACAAHLATRNQQRRMCETLPAGSLLTSSDPPSIDVFVLYVNRPGQRRSRQRGSSCQTFMRQPRISPRDSSPSMSSRPPCAASPASRSSAQRNASPPKFDGRGSVKRRGRARP